MPASRAARSPVTPILSMVLVPLLAALTASPGRAWPPFTIETADDVGFGIDVGAYSSIKVDGAGNPHISYYDVTHSSLKYTHKLAGSWMSETVDSVSAPDVGSYSSIALDANGNPHISYHDASLGNLIYAHKSGGSWSIEVVDSPTDFVGIGTSIAVNKAGEPCIAYFDFTTKDLKYAHK